MNILIAAATPFEIAPLQQYLEANYESISPTVFTKENQQITLLITGVGMTNTALCLGRYLALEQPDIAINAGIAGSFSKQIEIGNVVHVISEKFADLGVEEADGSFTDMHEMDLIPPNEPPFQYGQLINPASKEFNFLPKAGGLTVNKVHGTKKSIKAIKKKYPADVETMEGAAFFLACLNVGLPFMAIRAISNFVEPRNRDNWNLPLAISNLNEVLLEMIGAMQETTESE